MSLGARLRAIESWLEAGMATRSARPSPEKRAPPLSTGHARLDAALGTGGGFPRGRIVELLGAPSSGKTTWALRMIASLQRHGGAAAFIDADHTLDGRYAAGLGVRTTDLWFSRPETGEEALEIVDRFLEAKALDLIVLDSVAALLPGVEQDAPYESHDPEAHAELLGCALPGLAERIRATPTVLLCLDHAEREGEGVARAAVLRLKLEQGSRLRILKDPWLLALPEMMEVMG